MLLESAGKSYAGKNYAWLVAHIPLLQQRGRRVARMVREADSLAERIDTLKNAGSIQWSGRRLSNAKPVARVRAKRTIAEIVIESRE